MSISWHCPFKSFLKNVVVTGDPAGCMAADEGHLLLRGVAGHPGGRLQRQQDLLVGGSHLHALVIIDL